MSNLLTACMYTCIALSWFRPREVRPSGLAVATAAAEAAEVTAVAAVEQQVDDDTVVRFQRGRIQSSTRRSYGDQLPRYRNFFLKRRGWSYKAAYSDLVWLESVGPMPRREVWTRRLRERELIILIAWLYEGEQLRFGQVKTFCKGIADQMRLLGWGDLADLLQAPAVMVARNYKQRETARVRAILREANACKMLEGRLVIEYARGQWQAGLDATDMRLVDRAIGSTILLTLVQCSLRVSSLCRTESVPMQTGPTATRCLAPDGGVALDKNILWCVDVSLAVRGMEAGSLVVRTAFAVSKWWSLNPAAVLKVEWMGVAFRSTKTNADGKRANKFRVDRDCLENGEYLDRMLLVVGMGSYDVEHDAFFSRPVSEQVARTLSRRQAVMVDSWGKKLRADYEHEGRIRHVFKDTFANLLAKEVASVNGLDDTHVTTKSLKILAISTLEEARSELGLTQTQVASYCDHQSRAGNAAYKQLRDRKTTLSLVATAAVRPVSWGVSAVPEPVTTKSKKRARKEVVVVAAVSGASLVTRATLNREGKRSIKAPVRLGD